MVRLIILRLTESFFRNRGLYQLPAVLMIVLAGLYVLLAPRVYVSSGALYVQKESLLSSMTNSGSAGFSWTSPAQVTVGDLYELMSTDAFVRSVVHKTALEQEITADPAVTGEILEELRTALSFRAIGENLIGFTGTYKDPRIAQEIAQATVDTYIQWKLNVDKRESLVAQEFFAKQIEPLQAELEQAQAELRAFLAAHPAPVRGDRPTDEALALEQLRGRVAQAIDRIENARTRTDDARLSQSIAESEVYQNYRVVDAPSLPTKPTLGLRGMLVNIIIFVVVGVVLSVAGIVGGAVLDRTLRFPLDVRHGLHLPVLATLPDTRAAAPGGWLFWRAPSKATRTYRPLVAAPAVGPGAGQRPGAPLEQPITLEDLMRNHKQPLDAGRERADEGGAAGEPGREAAPNMLRV